jgi:hypothetical protein
MLLRRILRVGHQYDDARVSTEAKLKAQGYLGILFSGYIAL